MNTMNIIVFRDNFQSIPRSRINKLLENPISEVAHFNFCIKFKRYVKVETKSMLQGDPEYIMPKNLRQYCADRQITASSEKLATAPSIRMFAELIQTEVPEVTREFNRDKYFEIRLLWPYVLYDLLKRFCETVNSST